MSSARRIVLGFKRPPEGALSENERAWIEFLRIVSNNGDPKPTLARVQALRRLFDTEVFDRQERPVREEWPDAERPADPRKKLP